MEHATFTKMNHLALQEWTWYCELLQITVSGLSKEAREMQRTGLCVGDGMEYNGFVYSYTSRAGSDG